MEKKKTLGIKWNKVCHYEAFKHLLLDFVERK